MPATVVRRVNTPSENGAIPAHRAARVNSQNPATANASANASTRISVAHTMKCGMARTVPPARNEANRCFVRSQAISPANSAVSTTLRHETSRPHQKLSPKSFTPSAEMR